MIGQADHCRRRPCLARLARWRIPETKNNAVVVVPLVAPAVAMLQERREAANGGPWVFFRATGAARIYERHKGRGERIVERAGLVDLRVHDLRRSLGSWMAGQNTSLTIVGKVLGHKIFSFSKR